MDAGSIAFGSWNGNQMSGDPNNPGLSRRPRAATAPSWPARYRLEYLKLGATTFSFFSEGFNAGTSELHATAAT